MRRTYATWVAVSILATTVHASPDTAKGLFDEGRAFAKSGHYAEACEKFEQSLALDAETGTMVNLADCREHQGKLLDAWHLFDQAAVESLRAGNATRAKFARDRADALGGKLAVIVLHFAEPSLPGVTLTIGGVVRSVAAASRDQYLPGEYKIVVAAAGHKTFETTVHAPAGETTEVAVPVLAPDAPLPTTTPTPTPTPTSPPPPHVVIEPPAEAPPATRRDPGRVRITWILGGAASATAVAGLGLALYAKHDYDRAVAAHDIAGGNHDVHLADLATGLGVATAGLAAASAIVYVTAPRERITITSTATPHGVGVTLTRRF